MQGDEDAWLANTKKFTDATGVQVRVDKESWEDIRPKAAVAANVGSGPDLMFVWFDDAHQYPDKLLDVTDLGDYLGDKYGGWYDGPKGYATRDGKFIGLPLAAIGNAIVYRDSWVKEAGFSEFPKDTAGFLELCKALQKNGHPAGFTHGHGVGDGNNYAHWLLWSHGGKMVDESGKVAINSPETLKAIEYAMELYKTFIPGTESWLDVNNNRAFLAGELGGHRQRHLGLQHGQDQQGQRSEARRDRQGHPHHQPADRPGRPSRSSCTRSRSAVIFDYTPYPNAAKAYLQFMFEEPQMNDWIKGSLGYCCQTLKAFANNPIWTADPERRRLCQGVGDAAPQRLCRPARLRFGRHHGRLRAGRHVRQGGHRPGDAAGGDGRGREARQPVLSGLGSSLLPLHGKVHKATARGDRFTGSAHRRPLLAPRREQIFAGSRNRHHEAAHGPIQPPHRSVRRCRSARGKPGLLVLLASCCRRRRCCSSSSPIRSASASGSASPIRASAGPAIFIGLENYEYLWDDSVFWLSVFNTLLYTVSRLDPEIRARPLAGAYS